MLLDEVKLEAAKSFTSGGSLARLVFASPGRMRVCEAWTSWRDCGHLAEDMPDVKLNTESQFSNFFAWNRALNNDSELVCEADR